MSKGLIFSLSTLSAFIVFFISSLKLLSKGTLRLKGGISFLMFFVLETLWAFFAFLGTLRIFKEVWAIFAKLSVILGELGILSIVYFFVQVSYPDKFEEIILIETVLFGFLLYSNIVSSPVSEIYGDFLYWGPPFTEIGEIVFMAYTFIAIGLILYVLFMMQRKLLNSKKLRAIRSFILGFSISFIGAPITVLLASMNLPIYAFQVVSLGTIFILYGYVQYPSFTYIIPQDILLVAVIPVERAMPIWQYTNPFTCIKINIDMLSFLLSIALNTEKTVPKRDKDVVEVYHGYLGNNVVTSIMWKKILGVIVTNRPLGILKSRLILFLKEFYEKARKKIEEFICTGILYPGSFDSLADHLLEKYFDEFLP